ncbi:hypothetical protein AQJ64_02925 [Streptomyces griseoruber]|uniref:Uncharacterized protein n=1 Tax=Streptomyces griseoruber TaxID=1943 RepID=A0A101TAE7_9ACTN|nr:hypothetical protein AQJ64_02925 [Streptomyces griseoruber]
MDPEAVQLRDLEGLGGGVAERLGLPGAQLADGDDGHLQGAEFDDLGILRVGVADTGEADVLVAEVRAETLQVGEVALAAAGGERRLLAARGADAVGVAGVPEVGRGSPTALRAWEVPPSAASPYRPRRRSASDAPSWIEQSPPRTTGKPPARTCRSIRSASRRVYAARAAALKTPSPSRQSPRS